MPPFSTNQNQVLGAFYGALVGDALGVPVEFSSREERKHDPVTDMRAYGVHHQPAGTWSDDGAMFLCSIDSLNEYRFDAEDMAQRFLQWYHYGLWAAHHEVFDIGIATSSALQRFKAGAAALQAGENDLYSNGNGSLMRILPVVLASINYDEDEFAERISQASSITHRHPRSQLACVYYGLVTRELLRGNSIHKSLNETRITFRNRYEDSPELTAFHHLLNRDITTLDEKDVPSGGYVMETLLAALWCLATTSGYRECVLKAVNLGRDTDTTGCVAGGLAGLVYGMNDIPPDWLYQLPRQSDLKILFSEFISQRMAQCLS